MSSSGFLDGAKNLTSKIGNYIEEKVTGGSKKPDIVIKPDDGFSQSMGKIWNSVKIQFNEMGGRISGNVKKRMGEKGSFRQNVDLYLCDSSSPCCSYWIVYRVTCGTIQGFTQRL